MATKNADTTRAEAVRLQIRDEILRGHLIPGERLKFPELCARYDASVGAIREALAALDNQGLVKSVPHRGYVVTPVFLGDLMELVEARCLIEPHVLASSVENATIEWEARWIAAHHVLSRVTPKDGGANRDIAFVEAHEGFHRALFGACPNRRLIDLVERLGADAALYRRWSDIIADGTRDIASEHASLLQAALDRNAPLAADLLLQHIRRTAQDILATQQSYPTTRT